ncbi:MurR/RpiR family transcriptional regulator [Filifactor villosus]|uniref:MurR/RpiR family transcriptional regulator n=1 Tax=Filifactor villosus TaxID=29374 RepID=A0ABV9QJD1_9FIRM
MALRKTDKIIKTDKNLIEHIEKIYMTLTKSQKIIAKYIMENYDKVAFMTAAGFAGETGVSESTVVRFANKLGYESYTYFQKDLQELLKKKLTTAQRASMSNYTNKSSIVKQVLRADIDNIKETMEELDEETFERVVELIFSAPKIYIVGLRSSEMVSEYLGYYLNFLLDNVKVVNYGINDVFEQILKVKKNDVVIGISFPRYSKRTSELMRFAKEQGAVTVSITDSETSPIAQLSQETMIAKSNMSSFVDSLVAPLSIANALIIALSMKKKEELQDNFSKLEKIWSKYEIY